MLTTTANKLSLKEAYVLGNHLMHQHGLHAEGWKFVLNSTRSSLGMCYYYKKTIAVSRYNVIYNSEDVVRNTILHEIAHVLAGKQKEYGHGKIWRDIAKSIGCDGYRCGSMIVPPKFLGVCPSCSREFKKSRRLKNEACGSCCKRYNNGLWHESFVIQWTKNS